MFIILSNIQSEMNFGEQSVDNLPHKLDLFTQLYSSRLLNFSKFNHVILKSRVLRYIS